MKYKKILIILLSLIIIGCTNNKLNKETFKQEYEKYNSTKIKLDIEENNIIEYVSKEEINKIIKSKTGVIFIGNPQDNLSRVSIKLLLEASDSTDLDKIYYISSLDKIENLDTIDNIKIPLVLFILNGKIIDYNIGTINDKIELSDNEQIDLYNKYLDGIHKVLQDTCDEEC